MRSLIFTALLLAVCSREVLGDVKCFLEKLTDCSKQLGHKVSLQMPDFLLCKYRNQLFECLHESAKECSVDKRYIFDDVETMYNEVCTEGTPLNKEMKKYNACVMNTFSTELSCIQAIIDYLKDKVITPEVMFEIEKMTCEKIDPINNCYFDKIGKDCGESARKFYMTIAKASNKVNEEICKDVLKKDNPENVIV